MNNVPCLIGGCDLSVGQNVGAYEYSGCSFCIWVLTIALRHSLQTDKRVAETSLGVEFGTVFSVVPTDVCSRSLNSGTSSVFFAHSGFSDGAAGSDESRVANVLGKHV